MIIWMIGAIFTLGLISKDEDGFWASILIIFLWPFMLGMFIRELVDEQKESPIKRNKPDRE